MRLYLAYLAVTTVLVLTPGSTTAVVVRNTLAGGHRAGLVAALGAALGNATHATAAGLGIWVLLGRWPGVLDAVRLGSAGYLAWLGARSLLRAWRHADGGVRMAAATERRATLGHHPSFVEGLTVNLLNPAIIAFYLAVVPTFIPPLPPRGYFAVLAATHVGMAFACHFAWASALHALGRFFARPGARRTLEILTGVALIWLAARVVGRI
jgi:threonine/homoserine/homoserine lactone efflux protein